MIEFRHLSTGRAAPFTRRQPGIRIRALPDQKVADVAEQLHCWVAGTIGGGVEYRLTISEHTAQKPKPDVPRPQ